MTNLKNSQMTEVLPEAITEDPAVQALSYAVNRQIQRLLQYADTTRIICLVHKLPHKMLDVLAVELRTPAYKETFSLETKRRLVKSTLLYYAKMGTKTVVEQVVADIFGSGSVQEWYKYDGEPYRFKVATQNPGITGAMVEEFKEAVYSVKRLSAWLDDVVLELTTEPMQQYYGFILHTGDTITLTMKA
ncbi:MAG: phage tail protein I [Clostridiaceae bacterium]|nr:phage tail protein I [Clostridiaceae bacterium]